MSLRIPISGSAGEVGAIAFESGEDGTDQLIVWPSNGGGKLAFRLSTLSVLGLRTGLKAHLSSEAGQCVLTRKGGGVQIAVKQQGFDTETHIVPTESFFGAIRSLSDRGGNRAFLS